MLVPLKKKKTKTKTKSHPLSRIGRRRKKKSFYSYFSSGWVLLLTPFHCEAYNTLITSPSSEESQRTTISCPI
jgi:hypothetical protein